MEKATQVVRQVCQPKFKVPDGECDLLMVLHFGTNSQSFLICILELFDQAMKSGNIPEDKNFKVNQSSLILL